MRRICYALFDLHGQPKSWPATYLSSDGCRTFGVDTSFYLVPSIHVCSEVDIDKFLRHRTWCQYAGFCDQCGDEVWWLQKSVISNLRGKLLTV